MIEQMDCINKWYHITCSEEKAYCHYESDITVQAHDVPADLRSNMLPHEGSSYMR